jgi:hypothetical protein
MPNYGITVGVNGAIANGVRAYFTYYADGRLFSPGEAPPLQAGEGGSVAKAVLSTPIISATLGNGSSLGGGGNGTTAPVTVVLPLLPAAGNGSSQAQLLQARLTCVFFRYSQASSFGAASGVWDPSGCVLVDANTTHVQCNCTHLTNFCVVTGVNSAQSSPASSADVEALSAISITGMSVSLPCLLATILLYMWFPQARTTAKAILVNLCLALLVGDVLFLVAIDKTSDSTACQAIAVVLYYFVLASFAWMLVSGYELHRTFTAVFDPQLSMPRYMSIGWGVPALITAIAAGGWSSGFGETAGSGTCWLSTDGDRLIWALIAPLIVMVVVNIIFFGRVMVVITKYPRRAPNMTGANKYGKRTTADTVWRALKTSSSLFALLNITWAFGVLALAGGDFSLAMQYAFVITCSLQGAIIFYFHCWTDEALPKFVIASWNSQSTHQTFVLLLMLRLRLRLRLRWLLLLSAWLVVIDL